MDNGVRVSPAHRGEYGVDGNIYGVLGISIFTIGLIVLAVYRFQTGHRSVAIAASIGAASLLFTIAVYLHTTRRGKFAVWADILDQLQLRGDERVLDIGCGRGAVLMLTAKAVPRGRVVGLDIWSRADQSGNSRASAEANLAAEGVSDRCELTHADMRAMPFPDASFDLVVSSLAIHNVMHRDGRSAAIAEIARVLKPGGRVAIADLAHTGTYARCLEEHGLTGIRRRSLGWRFWWAPGMATRLITATKPAA